MSVVHSHVCASCAIILADTHNQRMDFWKTMTKPTKKPLHLVTLGETMIRHFTRHHHRLEQCADLGFSIAGSESNLAVAASRLGLSCGWISKLVDNPLGRKIEREISVHGVDLSRVVWTDKGRVGVFYIEFGSVPRPTQVTYDRKGSVASTLRSDEVDWGYVRSAQWFHTTGITCALSNACLESVRAGIREAHKGSTKVSLDLNYRAKLWSTARCRKVMSTILPDLDLLIAGSDDIRIVFGFAGTGDEQAVTIQEKFGTKTVLVPCGSKGAVVRDEDGNSHEISFDRFAVKEVDRIGAGDAFAAGFFAGLIEKDIDLGLLYGAATCAWKYSVPGDHALLSREEMLEVVQGTTGGVRR